MITVTLSAYSLGNPDHATAFAAWLDFVCDRIDAAVGFEVDRVRMSRDCPIKDVVEGATEEQEAEILEWLSHAGWDAFCAAGMPGVEQVVR